MIKTIVCTRGLIFAQTILSLQQNEAIDGLIIISGLPIPEAQNEGVRQAMNTSASHIWLVEDDMDIPAGTLPAMLKLDKPIVAVDYPMDNGYSTICRQGEEIIWCGLGCTLISTSVLRAIGNPWFDTSYSYKIKQPFELERIDNPSKYGGQDINFCMAARERGYRIEQLPGVEARHLRCGALQKIDYNQGAFEIAPLAPVTHRQQY